jgi:hypothetical protein
MLLLLIDLFSTSIAIGKEDTCPIHTHVGAPLGTLLCIFYPACPFGEAVQALPVPQNFSFHSAIGPEAPFIFGTLHDLATYFPHFGSWILYCLIPF